MKAISLWQPWATLIAIGAKQFETRSWATSYRGPLAIHASKRKVDVSELNPTIVKTLLDAGFTGTGQLPLGCIVCIVDLTAVISAYDAVLLPRFKHGSSAEVAFGNYTPGRWVWKLENVQPVDNIPARGSQGFWEWDTDTDARTGSGPHVDEGR